MLKGIIRQTTSIHCSFRNGDTWSNLNLNTPLGIIIKLAYIELLTSNRQHTINGKTYYSQITNYKNNEVKSLSIDIMGMTLTLSKYSNNIDGSPAPSDKVSLNLTMPFEDSNETSDAFAE